MTKLLRTEKLTIIVPSLPGIDNLRFVETLKRTDYPLANIELLISEGKNPSRQRNLAIDKATGEIIFFFDNDAEIPNNYLKKAMQHYQNQDINSIGGPVETSNTDPFLQKCFGYVIGSYFATQSMSNKFKGQGEIRPATEKELILCNFSIRKISLGKHRFDERLYPNEENELLNRLSSQGKKLIYDPDLKVYRKQRGNLAKFAKQFYKYGYGRIEHILIRPSSISPIFLIPLLFVIYIVSLIISAPSQKTNLLYFIPLLVYILIALVSSIKIAIDERNLKTLMITPGLFFIVHISYGMGMITSLLTFRRKERPKEVKITKIRLI